MVGGGPVYGQIIPGAVSGPPPNSYDPNSGLPGGQSSAYVPPAGGPSSYGQIATDFAAANPGITGSTTVNGQNIPTPPAGASPQQSYDYRSDPSYLALVNALDFQGSTYYDNAQHQLSRIDENLPLDQADLTRQFGLGQRQIDLSLEDRGVLNSGERLQRQADATAQYNSQYADLGRTAANAKVDINDQLAADMAGVARQKAQTGANFATPPLPKQYFG